MHDDTRHLIAMLCQQADDTADALRFNRDKLNRAKLPGFAMDAARLRDIARQVSHALSTIEAR